MRHYPLKWSDITSPFVLRPRFGNDYKRRIVSFQGVALNRFMEFRHFLEAREEEIRNLQANSVMDVYHGTTLQDAYNFCVNGIDAKQPRKYRIYLHTSGGNPIKFGLFVAPDPKTAFKFGNYVVEFSATGKDLIYKFPVEMKQYNQGYLKQSFPNSFRPAVSDDMLNNPIEPQALFIGLVDPHQIKAVYSLKNYSLDQMVKQTPAEFIAIAKTKNVKEKSSDFTPGEYKMDLGTLVHRIAQQENSTDQEIFDTLVWIYKRNGYLTGIGHVPWSLLRRIERQLASYIQSHDK